MTRIFSTLLAFVLFTPTVNAQETQSLKEQLNSTTSRPPAQAAKLPPRTSRNAKRKPASIKAQRYSDTGIPLLPNGEPDYSKFPNPFVVKRWAMDVTGLAGATVNRSVGSDYTEFGVGIDAYFYDFLDWHNVFFYRMAKDGSKMFGLDTSERFIYAFGRRGGLGVFGSPGFRFASQVGTIPFFEAGAQYTFGKFKVCAGAREMLGTAVITGFSNEIQYLAQLERGFGK